MNRVSAGLMICILSCDFVFAGCAGKAGDSESDVRPRALIEVGTAYLGDISEDVKTMGSFEVLRDEKVKSTVAGKVEKVNVLEGDRVKKGDVVVSIVSEESFAAIEGANQLLSQATTETDRKRAEESLRLAESTATIARIAAPFSGGVVRRFVTEGELVAQGADLVEIIDPGTEYFVASVPISQLSPVKIGESAEVTIPGMTMLPLRGRVAAIDPTTDPNSQSVEVRIDLGSIPSTVAPGTFGDVTIEVGVHRSVTLVPKQSIYHDDELDRYYVWRIQGDSIAILTQVGVGLSDSALSEILSGIKPGDIVATVGGYGLPDSTNVTVQSK